MRRQRPQHQTQSSSPDGEAAAPSSPWGLLLPPPLPPRRRCRASPAGTASRGPARQRTGAGWCLGAAVRSRCFPWPRRWPGCGPRRRGLEREREIREKVAKVEGQKKRLLTKQPPLFPFLFLSLSLSLSLLPLPTAGVWKGADAIALLSSRAGSCGARPGKEEACGEESVVGREVEFFRRLRVEVEREESSLRRNRFPLSTSLPPFFPSSLPFEPLETSSSRHLDVNQSEKRT